MSSNNKSKLLSSLDHTPTQPPIKKAPRTYPLSTQDADALSHESDNAPSHHRTIAPSHHSDSATDDAKRVNRGYKLREDLIKSLKRVALEEDRLLYEVMEEALVEYLDRKKAG